MDATGRFTELQSFDSIGNISTEIDADYAAPQGSVVQPDLSNGPVQCGTDTENRGSRKWSDTMDWWTNGTVPALGNLSLTIQNIRNAHTEWTANQSWCSNIPDSSSFTTSYQGTNNASFGNDGISEFGFGDASKVCTGNGLVGCTQSWFSCPSTCSVVEADIRLNASTPWQNGTSDPSSLDVWSVAAHEMGHAAQFGDLTDDNTNVMYHKIASGNDSYRELGKGDAIENNGKY
jgi:hypothetical protein